MTIPLKQLEQRLDYRFADTGLLQQALTHRSVGSQNNERLEFLGDSILNFTITSALYAQLPESDEGDLSRIRASLVRGETLASIAAELQLSDFIHLGPGERRSGGRQRVSVQADAVEAIIGAVLLDGGIDACQKLILRIFAVRLGNLPDAEQLKDPKTRLQEYLQARQIELPAYEIMQESGKDHEKLFKVSCMVEGLEKMIGQGSSRRKAEQDVAKKILSRLIHGQ